MAVVPIDQMIGSRAQPLCCPPPEARLSGGAWGRATRRSFSGKVIGQRVPLASGTMGREAAGARATPLAAAGTRGASEHDRRPASSALVRSSLADDPRALAPLLAKHAAVVGPCATLYVQIAGEPGIGAACVWCGCAASSRPAAAAAQQAAPTAPMATGGEHHAIALCHTPRDPPPGAGDAVSPALLEWLAALYRGLAGTAPRLNLVPLLPFAGWDEGVWPHAGRRQGGRCRHPCAMCRPARVALAARLLSARQLATPPTLFPPQRQSRAWVVWSSCTRAVTTRPGAPRLQRVERRRLQQVQAKAARREQRGQRCRLCRRQRQRQGQDPHPPRQAHRGSGASACALSAWRWAAPLTGCTRAIACCWPRRPSWRQTQCLPA